MYKMTWKITAINKSVEAFAATWEAAEADTAKKEKEPSKAKRET